MVRKKKVGKESVSCLRFYALKLRVPRSEEGNARSHTRELAVERQPSRQTLFKAEPKIKATSGKSFEIHF